jgi:hypothetical protein
MSTLSLDLLYDFNESLPGFSRIVPPAIKGGEFSDKSIRDLIGLLSLRPPHFKRYVRELPRIVAIDGIDSASKADALPGRIVSRRSSCFCFTWEGIPQPGQEILNFSKGFSPQKVTNVQQSAAKGLNKGSLFLNNIGLT